ncbi:MAG: MinD/ParA family protein [Calditerrivibrio sp.]|nr:MinD/ParA family protein [Calditerrivibrio sp.]
MDQADNLRKMAWSARRKSFYISVSSGKGGVGKTNFSVNLAYLMCKMGKKVLLFDADLGLANVDIIINLTSKVNIKDFLEGKVGADSVLVKTDFGFDVVPASSGFVSLTKLKESDYDRLLDLFVKIDSSYDYVIFDTGAGIGENVIKFSSISDLQIVITQPEPTAVTDAYAFIKVVHNEFRLKNIYLVVNRAKTKSSGEQIYENLSSVLKKFIGVDLGFLGIIRECSEVGNSVRSQKPIVDINPDSVYSKDIVLVAKKILNLQIDRDKSLDMMNIFRGNL